MTRGVAITGLGVLAPGATGHAEFSEVLRAGNSTVAEVTRFDTSACRSHRAAMVTEFKPRDFIAMAKMRRMNTLSRFAMAAAKMVVDDTELAAADYGRAEVGVAIGTVFGPVQTSVDYMDEYVAKGPSLAPPQLFAESVANAPGSHVAIEYGFEGFNLTFTQRESSAAVALMYASQQIVKGVTRAALVGGVDEVTEITFSVLDRLGALARASGELDEAMRPFDRQRNGMCAGEGAAALFLEATPRRDPYAWVRGVAVGRDATATISDWGSNPAAIERVMREALDDAELQPADVDAVWASANGNRLGDRSEYLAIQQLFGNQIPPVIAPKGYFGEYAAGGALQLVSAVLALRDGELPRSPGFAQGEDAMLFSLATAARATQLRHIIVNTVSAGGGIACIVLSRSID